jgi:hypothetical protein
MASVLIGCGWAVSIRYFNYIRETYPNEKSIFSASDALKAFMLFGPSIVLGVVAIFCSQGLLRIFALGSQLLGKQPSHT